MQRHTELGEVPSAITAVSSDIAQAPPKMPSRHRGYLPPQESTVMSNRGATDSRTQV